MERQRKLLAELMAPLLPDTQRKFSDKNICKNFLVCFCPNELFTNTKADLGPCPLIHDDKLHIAYQESPEKGKHGWERDFYERLQKLVNTIDLAIKRGILDIDDLTGRDRINVKAPGELADSKDEQTERIIMIEKKIQELLQKVESAGEEGRVEEAKALLVESEKYKIELELVKKGEDPLSQADRRMEVCSVCGAYLIVNDCQIRMEAHLIGKQHTGYQKIREKYEELKNNTKLWDFPVDRRPEDKRPDFQKDEFREPRRNDFPVRNSDRGDRRDYGGDRRGDHGSEKRSDYGGDRRIGNRDDHRSSDRSRGSDFPRRRSRSPRR